MNKRNQEKLLAILFFLLSVGVIGNAVTRLNSNSSSLIDYFIIIAGIFTIVISVRIFLDK